MLAAPLGTYEPRIVIHGQATEVCCQRGRRRILSEGSRHPLQMLDQLFRSERPHETVVDASLQQLQIASLMLGGDQGDNRDICWAADCLDLFAERYHILNLAAAIHQDCNCFG
ncbi:hypothetical protein D3C87_1735000 [compost metagenome]